MVGKHLITRFASRGAFSTVGNAYPNYGVRAFSVSPIRRDDVDVTVEGGIRTITMNRLSKHNAITDQMYRQMGKSLLESNRDEATKIVVITGVGEKYFTSGYDLKNLIQDYNNRVPAGANGATVFISSLIECKKPLIGLVNGSAVGIGVTLLAHCEAVYASDQAHFNTPFIKLGIPPECCSSYLFPKIVGHAKAGALLHFNDTWTAQEAYEYGLVTRVFPQDKFKTEAWKLVKKMAEHPAETLLNSKALLRDKERPLLRKVFEEENSKFDVEVVGQSAMKLIASRK
ncbi:enoyl-CoA delta isomerase 2 [Folsomia candida]|uniref:Enoyl-CoA delta isomerase 2, mitochondrial n=1 Tax=Folsomia candida TaxID=158441 RepID=A0A226EQ05_FOLCA|nr:enoyl-CoA delta isomerase 2 [Folsomia candida]OXA58901.1 Enoyl-CoA delta isomerase 2, mitochondrial [Folsomia candida]